MKIQNSALLKIFLKVLISKMSTTTKISKLYKPFNSVKEYLQKYIHKKHGKTKFRTQMFSFYQKPYSILLNF
jgi:hypothetical protein